MFLDRSDATFHLSQRPDLEPYVDAVSVMVATGKAPWEFGESMSMKKLWTACRVMAPYIIHAQQAAGGCPLIEALGGGI